MIKVEIEKSLSYEFEYPSISYHTTFIKNNFKKFSGKVTLQNER